MRVATFSVEHIDDKPTRMIIIEIGALIRDFMRQKQASTISMQHLCALVATFIKKGEGLYEVVNDNEESSDDEE